MHAPLLDALRALPARSVVGLSGIGGAGKSTLAADVEGRLPGLAVVPADGFLVRDRCLAITDDWSGLDRERLRGQLLAPFRAEGAATWDEYDWASDSYAPRSLPPCRILLVEGVGLLHPSLHWDLAVWLGADPDEALSRAMARDVRQGVDLAGWAIWSETDRRYVARFRPERTADLVIDAASVGRQARA